MRLHAVVFGFSIPHPKVCLGAVQMQACDGPSTSGLLLDETHVTNAWAGDSEAGYFTFLTLKS